MKLSIYKHWKRQLQLTELPAEHEYKKPLTVNEFLLNRVLNVKEDLKKGIQVQINIELSAR